MPSLSTPVVDDPLDIHRHLSAYLDAVERGDRRAAIDVAVGLVEGGADAERVITDLLAGAQREVGRRWEEGTWTVAIEHRASAITESALQAVTEAALRAPGALAEGSRGRAIVACSDGEWHVLPGRMASEILRLRGADVSYVGPSVPAGDLAAMLGDDPPSAVAITCSLSMSLSGAWHTISALRPLGMTIVCGGRGFGAEGRWGIALGADLWAPDFSSGADLLLAALEFPPPPPRGPVGTAELIEEIRVLERDHETLVEAAYARALDAWPHLREDDVGMRATREDLSSTLRTIRSATIVNDSVIVTDQVRWFESVLGARDLPLAFVPAAFTLLLDVLPPELPNAKAMAVAGLDACAATSA